MSQVGTISKRKSLWRKSRDMTKDAQLVSKHLSQYGAAATSASSSAGEDLSVNPAPPPTTPLTPNKGLGDDDSSSEGGSHAEHDEHRSAAPKRSAPVITAVDNALMNNYDEDGLTELLEQYREDLSNLEVRRSDLETLDRQLDDDRTNLVDAIKNGVQEKEQLRRDLENARGEMKVLRDQIAAMNKDRKIHETELASFQKNHISLKDSFKETVWTRVDLEDMLRMLDRDLQIMKNKLSELDKAANQSSEMESKLVRLKSSAVDKMKEATAIDAFRESYSQRLHKLSADLFDISMERVRLVEGLEGQIRKKKQAKKASGLDNTTILNASQLIIALQEMNIFASSSQDMYFSAMNKYFQMIGSGLDAHKRESNKLLGFVQLLVSTRRRSATYIQKANSQLERFCLLLRTNKKFTPEDIKTLVTVLNDLDAIWPSLDDFSLISTYGIDRFLQMITVSKEIDSLILKHAEIASQTRRQIETVNSARTEYLELARENAAMQAQLNEMVRTRKLLESQLR